MSGRARCKQIPHMERTTLQSANLDEGMVEELAGGPPHPGLTLQAVRQEVLPFRAQPFRDWWFMPHSHFIHNLKVVFIFMPRPLKRGKKAGFNPTGS